MSNLVELIKKIAIGAVEEASPMRIVFGQVTKATPLEILVEQRLRIGAQHLLLTGNVINRSANVAMDYSTQSADGHTHAVSGAKQVDFQDALAVDEKVILLQMQGGQKYVVLDRVVSA